MTTQTLSIKCSRCNGSGIDDNTNPPSSCVACGGDGYVESALVDTTELMNELDWIKKKIKNILKKLDVEEE